MLLCGLLHNLAMEKLITWLRVFCRNDIYGCKQLELYDYNTGFDYLIHECMYEPCWHVIISSQINSSKKLYQHLKSKFNSNVSFDIDFSYPLDNLPPGRYIIYQEETESKIFVISHTNDTKQGAYVMFQVHCLGSTTKYISEKMATILSIDTHIILDV